MTVHQPVMVERVTRLLLEPGGSRFIDCTLGTGGHSEALLNSAGRRVQLLGLDKDPDSVEVASRRLKSWTGVKLIRGDFAELDKLAPRLGFDGVDGILADFGQSSFQLDDPGRGFSFRFDAPLDMRYDRTSGPTAADIVNGSNRGELAAMLRQIGEERRGSSIAAAIVRRRPIRTCAELAAVIRDACPSDFIEKTLARVFMALRVVVNDELNAIERFLPAALELLKPGGRMVCISYDSHQDRRVKLFFRGYSRGCTCPPELPLCVCGAQPELKILTRRVVRPDRDEIDKNVRSRSARLRAAEKVKGG